MHGAGLHGCQCAKQHANQPSERDASSAVRPAANSTEYQERDADHGQHPDSGAEGQIQPARKIQNQANVAAITVFPPESEAQAAGISELVGMEIPG